MSIESIGFTSREGNFPNAARFLEGDLRQGRFAVLGGLRYAGEATDLRLAEEIGTTEIKCENRGGTTEIRCEEEMGTTEIRCGGTGTTEIRCPEEIGTTEIRCGGTGTTEIRCS